MWCICKVSQQCRCCLVINRCNSINIILIQFLGGLLRPKHHYKVLFRYSENKKISLKNQVFSNLMAEWLTDSIVDGSINDRWGIQYTLHQYVIMNYAVDTLFNIEQDVKSWRKFTKASQQGKHTAVIDLRWDVCKHISGRLWWLMNNILAKSIFP